MIGMISGRLMRNRCPQNPAPSTAAASWMSCGIELIPARMMTVARGSRRQTSTMTIDAIARSGWPSQIGQNPGPNRCSARALQLITLYTGSKIHSQPIDPSEIGSYAQTNLGGVVALVQAMNQGYHYIKP